MPPSYSSQHFSPYPGNSDPEMLLAYLNPKIDSLILGLVYGALT